MRTNATVEGQVVWPQDGRDAYRIVAHSRNTVAGATFGWHRCIENLRRWRWLMCLYILVWAVAAYHLDHEPEQYRAHVVLLVVGQGSHRPLAAFRAIHLETVFHNVVVAEEIVRQNRLDQNTRSLMGLTENRSGETVVDSAARAFLHCVSVNYESKTGQAYIFVTHPNPSVAVALANDCAEAYMKHSRDAVGSIEDANNRFLIAAGTFPSRQRDPGGESTARPSSRSSSSDAGAGEVNPLNIAVPPKSETVLMQQRATVAISTRVQIIETYVLGFIGGSLALLVGMITNFGFQAASTEIETNELY